MNSNTSKRKCALGVECLLWASNHQVLCYMPVTNMPSFYDELERYCFSARNFFAKVKKFIQVNMDILVADNL